VVTYVENAMDQTDSFGYWLRRRRKALDLTQGGLAQRVGCSIDLIQKIETEARRPSRQVAERLAAVLGLSGAEHTAFIQAARAERRVDQMVLPNRPLERPAHARQSNLPEQLTPLVGRAQEVATIEASLRRAGTRLMTLTGPGGVGKTRLGLQVAANQLETFADGVYFVDLAPLRDPALLLHAIAQALGVQEGGSPLMGRLKDVLRDQQLLLLLDNFEHVLAAASQVAELLAATLRLKMLVTSRERLHLRGEQEVPVHPLALPDPIDLPALDALQQCPAVTLFVQRARARRPDFTLTDMNSRAVAEICVRLDGLPLAIELAAARVTLCPPPVLLARLSDRLTLLTGGPRDGPARQQTIRQTIAWSYHLLSADEQTLFRRLSVFAGGCTLEALEAIALDDFAEPAHGDIAPRDYAPLQEPHETLDLVGALVDKSLLQQIELPDGSVRFRMLEVIREYAREQLGASGEAEALLRRHAAYFLALAETQWQLGQTEQIFAAWMSGVDREYDNLRAALHWYQTSPGKGEAALRFTQALICLWWYRGASYDAIAAIDRSLNHPDGVGRTIVQLDTRTNLAELLALIGNYPEAQRAFEYALELAGELGEEAAQAYMLGRLGWVAREQGDILRAWDYLQESLAVFRTLDLPYHIVTTLNTMAEVAIVEEDAARAEMLLAESLELAQQIEPDEAPLAWTFNHLGHLAQLRGEYERAIELHQTSLAYFGDDYHTGLGEAYQGLGESALGLGRIAEATKWLTQGLRISAVVGHQSRVVWCLAGLGSAAALNGRAAQAARLWGAAERQRQAIRCRPAPATRATYERAVAAARTELGAEAFAVAWAAGQALDPQAALAEATGELVLTPPLSA
jgi:predicted ATPase/DNA-binding XRE family transcriptional regulator